MSDIDKHPIDSPQTLRNLRLETLVITGMATDMCVETTARDAADRGYNVIVVEDAVATFNPEHHPHALSSLARVFGQVWSTLIGCSGKSTLRGPSRPWMDSNATPMSW